MLWATVVLCVIIMACNPSPVEKRRKAEEESSYKVKINVSAGDLFSPFDKHAIPTFFNVGQFKSEFATTEVILLGERRSVGNTVDFDPIALLEFQKDTVALKYIVAVPLSESNNSEELLVKKYHLQNSMEEWFKAQGAFNECRNFNWGSSYKALLEIDGILENH